MKSFVLGGDHTVLNRRGNATRRIATAAGTANTKRKNGISSATVEPPPIRAVRRSAPAC